VVEEGEAQVIAGCDAVRAGVGGGVGVVDGVGAQVGQFVAPEVVPDSFAGVGDASAMRSGPRPLTRP
jgi:hypothetical protein